MNLYSKCCSRFRNLGVKINKNTCNSSIPKFGLHHVCIDLFQSLFDDKMIATPKKIILRAIVLGGEENPK